MAYDDPLEQPPIPGDDAAPLPPRSPVGSISGGFFSAPAPDSGRGRSSMGGVSGGFFDMPANGGGPEPGFLGNVTSALGSGALNFGASVAGAGEYLGGTGGTMTGIRQGLEGAAASAASGMSPGWQAAAGRRFLPGEGEASAFESPGAFLGALGVQAAQSVPSMLLTLIPAGVVARGATLMGAGAEAATVAAGLTAGGITGTELAGSTWNAISEAWRTAPESEVQGSPLYQQYFNASPGTPAERDRFAREMAARESAQYLPLIAGAIGAAAGGLLEGPMASQLAHRELGILQAIRAGAMREAGEEFTQSGVQETGQQLALADDAGLNRPMNPGRILAEGIQGATVGAAAGGAVGGAGGALRRPRQTGTVVDPDTDLAAREQYGPPQPPGTGMQFGPPVPPDLTLGRPLMGAGTAPPEGGAGAASPLVGSIAGVEQGVDPSVAAAAGRANTAGGAIQAGVQLPSGSYPPSAGGEAGVLDPSRAPPQFGGPRGEGLVMPGGPQMGAPMEGGPQMGVGSISGGPQMPAPSFEMGPAMGQGSFGGGPALGPTQQPGGPAGGFAGVQGGPQGGFAGTQGGPGGLPLTPQTDQALVTGNTAPSVTEGVASAGGLAGTTAIPAAAGALPQSAPAAAPRTPTPTANAESTQTPNKGGGVEERFGKQDAANAHAAFSTTTPTHAQVLAREKLFNRLAGMINNDARKQLINRVIKAGTVVPEALAEGVRLASNRRTTAAEWKAWSDKFAADETQKVGALKEALPQMVMDNRSKVQSIIAKHPMTEEESKGGDEGRKLRRQRVDAIEAELKTALGIESKSDILEAVAESARGQNAGPTAALFRLLSSLRKSTSPKAEQAFADLTSTDAGIRNADGTLNPEALAQLSEQLSQQAGKGTATVSIEDDADVVDENARSPDADVAFAMEDPQTPEESTSEEGTDESESNADRAQRLMDEAQALLDKPKLSEAEQQELVNINSEIKRLKPLIDEENARTTAAAAKAAEAAKGAAVKTTEMSKVAVEKKGERVKPLLTEEQKAARAAALASLLSQSTKREAKADAKGVDSEGNPAVTPAETVRALTKAAQDAVVSGKGDSEEIQRIFKAPHTGSIGVFLREIWRVLSRTTMPNVDVYIIPRAQWREAYGLDPNSRQAASQGIGVFIPFTAEHATNTGSPGVVMFSEDVMALPAYERERLFMHEMTHGATEYSVMHDKATKAKIRGIMDKVEELAAQHDPDGTLRGEMHYEHAMLDESEFVAAAFSDRQFQGFLANILLSDSDRRALGIPGAVSNMWRAAVDMVRRVLGLSSNSISALESVMAVTQFLDSFQTTEAAAMVYLTGANSATEPVLRQALAGGKGGYGMRGADWLTNVTAPRARTNLMDMLKRAGPVMATVRQLELLSQNWWKDSKAAKFFDPDNPHNPVQRVARAMLRRSQEAERILKEDFNRTISELNSLPETVQAEIAGLAQDSTLANIHPNVPLTDKKNAHLFTKAGVAKKDLAAIQGIKRHPDIAARYEALKKSNPEAAKLFLKIGEMTAKGHRQLLLANVASVLDRWYYHAAELAARDPNPVPLPFDRKTFEAFKARYLAGKETQADDQLLGAMGDTPLKMVELLRSRSRIEGYYVPLQRIGDFVVTWQTRPDSILRAATEQQLEALVGSSAENVVPRSKKQVTYDSKGVAVEKPDPATLKAHLQAARVQALKDAMLAGQQQPTAEELKKAEDKATADALAATKAAAVAAGGKTEWQAKLETQGVAYHETMADAQAHYEEMGKQGVTNLKNIALKDFSGKTDLGPALGPELNKLVKAFERDTQIDADVRSQIVDVLQRALITLTPAKVLDGSQVRRKGVAGASRELSRVLTNYGTAVSNFTAGATHALEMERGLSDMRANIAEARNNPKTPKNRGVAMARIMREYEQHINQNALDNLATSNGTLDVVTRNVQSLAFTYYLISPAYAAVQLMQPWMLSLPVIGGRHGAVGTSTALGKAMSDLGMGEVLKGGAKDAARNMKAVANRLMPSQAIDMFDIARANIAKTADGARLTQMMDELQTEGILGESGGLETIRSLKANAGWLGTSIAKAEAIGRSIPSSIEVVNRVGTAVAAYRLEYSKAKKAGKSEKDSHRVATDYARQVVDQSQADYAAANTSRMMRPQNSTLRALTAPMMTFRKYAQAMYSLLGSQFYAAVKGESKEVRRQAQRTLAGVLLTHVAMAGALGLPTEGIFLALGAVAMLFGDDEPWDIEKEIRKAASDVFGPELAEVLMRGLPRAANIDLSGRVGLDSLIFMKELRDFQSQTMAAYAGDLILGAPGGIGGRWASVPGLLTDGEWGKAFEAAMPKGFADIAKALRVGREGITTRRGERIDAGREQTAYDAVVQALGFTPTSTARVYERRDAVQGANRQFGAQRNEYLRRWRQAAPAERNTIWREEILPWNRSLAPSLQGSRITMQNLQSSLRESQRRERASGREDYLPKNRAALREEGRFVPR